MACPSTAKEVETIVRTQGAIPATVGVLNGRVHVGLSEEELDFLSRSKTALKVSRRDLPYVISKVGFRTMNWDFTNMVETKNAVITRTTLMKLNDGGTIICAFVVDCTVCHINLQGLSGGTTVSGTMIAAHNAGIPVFVTGGIGGVHRDGEDSKLDK